MKRLLILVFYLFLLVDIFCQQSQSVEYFPLHIGNTWIYYWSGASGAGHGSGFDRYKITGTIVSGGKSYFTYSHERIVIETIGIYPGGVRVFSGRPIRIDTNTANLYNNGVCDSSEFVIDSLNSNLLDSFRTCNTCSNFSRCTDTSSATFCGYNVSKTFQSSRFECIEQQSYIKGIGLVLYVKNYGMGTGCSSSLKGCVINGMVYCDTSFIVGVIPISSEIPAEFSLSQNYPNPFNPNSKIRFDIAKLSDVNLIVYDVIGNTVTLLVNQQLKPGTYEADFDGSNLASGVYYYKIVAGDYTESKKMILVK